MNASFCAFIKANLEGNSKLRCPSGKSLCNLILLDVAVMRERRTLGENSCLQND